MTNEITWENKAELVKLGNQKEDSNENELKFQEFTIKHISSFDPQTWDMFMQIIVLDGFKMKQHIDFWYNVYQHFKNVYHNPDYFDHMSLRAVIRMDILMTILEDEFKLNEK